LVCPHPSPLPILGEGARDYTFLSGSPSPNSGRRGAGDEGEGAGMHSTGFEFGIAGATMRLIHIGECCVWLARLKTTRNKSICHPCHQNIIDIIRIEVMRHVDSFLAIGTSLFSGECNLVTIYFLRCNSSISLPPNA
jgi:hypothetical protein